MTSRSFALVLLAACGSDPGLTDGGPADSAIGSDAASRDLGAADAFAPPDAPPPPPAEICGSGVDEDEDGRTDCDDGDCFEDASCRAAEQTEAGFEDFARCEDVEPLVLDETETRAACERGLPPGHADARPLRCDAIPTTGRFEVFCPDRGSERALRWRLSMDVSSEVAMTPSERRTTTPEPQLPDSLLAIAGWSGAQLVPAREGSAGGHAVAVGWLRLESGLVVNGYLAGVDAVEVATIAPDGGLDFMTHRSEPYLSAGFRVPVD